MAKPRPSFQRRLVIGLLLLIGALALDKSSSSASPTHERAEQQGPANWTIAGGSSVEREFTGGLPHAFQIELAAGDLFQGSIQQKGVDVIVTVSGPDGQKLDEFSEPVYENRMRLVSFIATSAGNYHLLVRPRLKEVTSGSYQLTVESVRQATELDRTRIGAAKLTKDANQALGKPGSLSIEEGQKLASRFEEALQLWQSLDDTWMVGESYLSLGIVSQKIGELTKALSFYDRALPLFPATPEGVGSKATTLNNIANVYLSLGETRRALEVLVKSLELKKEGGRSRAITLDNLGGVYTHLGEYQLALDHHLQALTSFRALGRRRDEATALNNLAWLWEGIGDPEKSVEYMLQALPLLPDADKDGKALYLSSLGYFYFLLGENELALQYANQALDLSRTINNRRTEASSLTLLCKVYPAVGEFDKAFDACNRVLLMHRDGGDPFRKATTLTAFSRVLEQTGQIQKAVESREASLVIYRALGDPTGELTTLEALGRLALDGGDLVSARRHLERAVEIVESMRIKVGSHQLRSIYMAGRQQVYESYLDLLMQMHRKEPGKGYDETALRFSERARARSLLDLLAEAHAQIRHGADQATLEKERTLLERLNAKDAAWRRLRNDERTKKQADSVAGEINDLTAQLQQVEGQIRLSSPRYAGLTQPQSLTHAEIQRQLLDENTVLLEFALGEKRSWLWAVTPTATTTHQLPPRREIEAVARRIYELLTSRQPKAGLTEAEQTARIKTADAAFQTEAASLSQMLFGEIAGSLRRELKGKRLAIVPSGALEYLPFAALPIPSNYNRYEPLIADHEVVNLPSASVLSAIRRETSGRPVAPGTVAILADPVFETNDPRLLMAMRRRAGSQEIALNTRSAGKSSPSPSGVHYPPMRAVRGVDGVSLSRLPFSGEEADAIAELVPARQRLKATDFLATRTKALSNELSNYRIVHFATHGLLNSQHPELSGLVLSLVDENGRAQDGFLRKHEIYNLRLPAEVVVLSACQTGLGKEIKGEGLIGLTRGFMYAGAQRVVASLWQVDDLATAQLMKHFYEAMLRDGLRPAAALRSAQIELMKEKRWSSPYFWAAFTLQGEWK